MRHVDATSDVYLLQEDFKLKGVEFLVLGPTSRKVYCHPLYLLDVVQTDLDEWEPVVSLREAFVVHERVFVGLAVPADVSLLEAWFVLGEFSFV
jgi:hypothetical protein